MSDERGTSGISRRRLLGGLAGAGLAAGLQPALAQDPAVETRQGWVVAATWKHGLAASQKALELLQTGQPALDAVEQGVRVSESDPEVTSVGRGGLPNAQGVVQLDAAIMRGDDRMIGAVGGLERIENPISVARKVLEDSRHVLLVGAGAQAFARQHGFRETDLLTPRAKARWEEWKKTQQSQPGDDHDTIGMLAKDQAGRLAAACTTSGLAWKLPGRVGDSPVPGCGLYADGEVGAATATGVGEEVLRTLGSFLIVELMRQGRTPLEACFEALRRIRNNPPRVPGQRDRQVGYIALRKDGAVAAAALQRGFVYALASADGKLALREAPVLPA